MDDNKLKKFIIGVSIAILLIPLLINGSMFIPGSITPSSLGQKDWLQFWSGYFGGLLGGVATFFAVYITYKHNTQMHEQNRTLQKDIKRMEIIPFIDIKISHVKRISWETLTSDLQKALNPGLGILEGDKAGSYHDNLIVFEQKGDTDIVVFENEGFHAYHGLAYGLQEYQEIVRANQAVERFKEVVIQNIGCNSAHSIVVSANGTKILPEFHLPKDGQIVFYIIFRYNVNEKDLNFTYRFKDLQNNEYIQTSKYKCTFIPEISYEQTSSNAPVLVEEKEK